MKPCNNHPLAPHGFDRTASHSSGEYVCECHGWSWEEYLEEELLNIKMKLLLVQDSFDKEDYEYDVLLGVQESLSELVRGVL